MARPASSYAKPEAEEARRGGSSPATTAPTPAPAESPSQGISGPYLTENPTLPSESTSGSASTYWGQSLPSAGTGAALPGYGVTADNYLRWVNSKYTPQIARATTWGEARDTLLGDPASYALAVRAARVWYAGYPNFDPQWAEGFLKEDVIPSAAGLGISAFELLNRIASGAVTRLPSSDAASLGGSYGGGGYGGGSSTQMTVDLASPTQARGLLMQTMQSVLGRDPSAEEYSQFLTSLNEAQAANPSVVSASGSTVTRSGGVDAGMLALDYAQSRDDYEDVQANQYYNMFLDVLAGG